MPAYATVAVIRLLPRRYIWDWGGRLSKRPHRASSSVVHSFPYAWITRQQLLVACGLEHASFKRQHRIMFPRTLCSRAWEPDRQSRTLHPSLDVGFTGQLWHGSHCSHASSHRDTQLRGCNQRNRRPCAVVFGGAQAYAGVRCGDFSAADLRVYSTQGVRYFSG